MTDGNFMFDTICYEKFKEFSDLFKVGDIKIIPVNIIDYLDPLTVAVWYQDDGHTTKWYSDLCTQGFTKEDNEILIQALKNKYDIIPTIRWSKGKYVLQPYLHFSFEEHRKLHKLVDPLFHSCFEYKKIILRSLISVMV